MKNLSIIALTTVLLTACGNEAVSFNTLEEAKQQARENALFNAQKYRTENVLLKDFSIIGRGDSTQDIKCPQGDGWATLEFVNNQNKGVIKVKCSTVSSATGCLEDSDFKTKPFASDDGQCQPQKKVPFPLPKIAR